MSFLEGGPMRCHVHDFETTDMDQWNDHCDDGTHFEFGATACITCGTVIVLPSEGIPYQPFTNGSKNYNMKCEACAAE